MRRKVGEREEEGAGWNHHGVVVFHQSNDPRPQPKQPLDLNPPRNPNQEPVVAP